MSDPDEGELDAAFDRGFEDAVHVSGTSIPPCPYPAGSALAKAWRRGLETGDFQ